MCIAIILITSITTTIFATESNVYEEAELYGRNADDAEEVYAVRNQYVRQRESEDAYALREAYRNEMEQHLNLRTQIAEYALSWVGITPYVWWTERTWGNSLTLGTDCSGFIHLIFREFGIDVPTGSAMYQDYVGHHITFDELLPGDILVYEYGSHVALYAGNGTVVHCSSPEAGTCTFQLKDGVATAYVRVID